MKKLFVFGLIAAMLLVFCAVDAQAGVSSDHWEIYERIGDGICYLDVDNYHSSLAITAFGVGILDDISSYETISENDDWFGMNANYNNWDELGAGTLDPDESLANIFGVSWIEAFGEEYFEAAVFIIQDDAPPFDPIDPNGGSLGWGNDIYYTFMGGAPSSPAIVLTQDGVCHTGETDINNPFQGGGPGVIPEPATLTLLGLGIAGLVARRRKRA